MFTLASSTPTDVTGGRTHHWHSKPGMTPTEDLIFVKVIVPPGGGHAFHTHPNKEEVIYVLSGEAEQWVEQEKQTLGPGSSAYIPKSAVHATFNRGSVDLEFIAVVTPCSAEGPIEHKVDHLEPWKSILENMNP